jgi:hypothetical protein
MTDLKLGLWGRLGSRSGAGPVTPAAVILAGAIAAWSLQFGGTGPRTAPTKVMTGDAVADGLPTGWTYVGLYTVQTNSNASAPLEGWDTNGRVISTNHSNVIIRDNLVRTLAANPSNVNGISISTSAAISNVLVEYNEIEGFTSDKIQNGIACHASAALSGITIRGNKIRHTRDDSIKGRGANLLIELNHCSRGGWGAPLAHWDCIDVTNPGGTFTVQDNFCDVTATANMFGRTSSITWAMCPSGGIVRRNIMGFGAATLDTTSAPAFYAAYSSGAEGQNGITSINAGVTVENNVIDYAILALWPTTRKGIISPSTANFRLSTGLAISETWSTTDNVPDAFTFADVTGAALSTLITSDNITLTGLTANSQVHVLLPNGTSYSLNNGGQWLVSGAIAFSVPVGAGGTATLRLRLTSAATPATASSIAVTAGGTVTDTWTVTTA